MKIIVKHIIVFLIIIASMFLFGCGFVEKEAGSRGEIQTAAEAEKEAVSEPNKPDYDMSDPNAVLSHDTAPRISFYENHVTIATALTWIRDYADECGLGESSSSFLNKNYRNKYYYSNGYDCFIGSDDCIYYVFDNTHSLENRKCISVLFTDNNAISGLDFSEALTALLDGCPSVIKYHEESLFDYPAYTGYYEIKYIGHLFRFIVNDGSEENVHLQIIKHNAELPESQLGGISCCLNKGRNYFLDIGQKNENKNAELPDIFNHQLINELSALFGRNINDLISREIISLPREIELSPSKRIYKCIYNSSLGPINLVLHDISVSCVETENKAILNCTSLDFFDIKLFGQSGYSFGRKVSHMDQADNYFYSLYKNGYEIKIGSGNDSIINSQYGYTSISFIEPAINTSAEGIVKNTNVLKGSKDIPKKSLRYIVNCANETGYGKTLIGFLKSDSDAAFHFVSDNCEYASVSDKALLAFTENNDLALRKCVSCLLLNPDSNVIDYFNQLLTGSPSEMTYHSEPLYGNSCYEKGFYELEYDGNRIRFIPYFAGNVEGLHVQISVIDEEIPQNQIYGLCYALGCSENNSVDNYESINRLLETDDIYIIHSLISPNVYKSINDANLYLNDVYSDENSLQYNCDINSINIGFLCDDNLQIHYIAVNLIDVLRRYCTAYPLMKEYFPNGFTIIYRSDLQFNLAGLYYDIYTDDFRILLPATESGVLATFGGTALIY